ncbi:MAG: tRNA (guanosine(46)-N7)-methyltransferase TrmB [Gammaproteobacteria bacterium]|nr:tRNA (guanosine(46)-N7)-methyltransferase TrmB [Gammaproteobacteria bacterium]
MSFRKKMTTPIEFFRHIKSFVRREGRMTDAQRRAIDEGMPLFGLHLQMGLINPVEIFSREAPCVLEIGFGMGHSLLQAAMDSPETDFIGIETHLPGVGCLLAGIMQANIKNIRVYHADAVQVLAHSIPGSSLSGIQIFFPDPWPKRRHHKRRLIQTPFVQKLTDKLHTNGVLHLATDWEDYAKHMMQVLSNIDVLENVAGDNQYAERCLHRPVVTRFEKRGKQAGYVIRDLQFSKK